MSGLIAALILAIASTFAETPQHIVSHSVITHSSSSPAFDRLIGDAIEQWGYVDGGHGTDIVGTPAWPTLNAFAEVHHVESCEVWMHPTNYIMVYTGTEPLDREFYRTVVVHEVGHCLGLSHTRALSVMNPSDLTSFRHFDRWLAWSMSHRRGSISAPRR